MSAHTPGPWRLERWVHADDAGWRVHIGDAPHRIEICEWSAESEADARLIAAAPELLAALKAMVAADAESGADDHCLSAARAAIAKAEGKS